VISGTDRILITGGAGLLGSHVSDLLVRQYNPEIVILDNFSRGRRENLHGSLAQDRVEIIEGDVRDADVVHEIMSGVDLVFHLVGMKPGQCSDDPQLGIGVLVNGTFNVLEAAALSGVRKIVSSSSTAVYGAAEHFPTREDHHPYNNRTLFGAARLSGEALMRSFHEMYGTSYVSLRYATVYGPRMEINGAYTDVLVRWIERLSRRQCCVIAGDGTRCMDLIYVEDAARAAVMAVESDISDEALNIGSGAEITLTGLARMLGRVMGSSLAPEYTPARKSHSGGRRLADTEKAARLLGFEARMSLEEGLRRLVAWWERQRALEMEIA
jgi:UDP-glucose 4-epimerase